MNKSYCMKCHDLVPTRRETREGKVYLVKECPKCGPNETYLSSDAERHFIKRNLDPGFGYEGCQITCMDCAHHRAPTYAFVDVTNRCNLNCPMCADGVFAHGFAFDPPLARSGTNPCLWRVADGTPSGQPVLLTRKGSWLGFDGMAFATDGKTVLLAWTTFRDGGGRSSGADKSGLLVLDADGTGLWPAEATGGTPVPPTPVPPGPAVQSLSSATERPRVRHPSPAWDGARYVVAWDVPRKSKEFSYEGVFYRCFAPDGKPLGGDEPVVDDPASPAYSPAVASDGAGTTLLAYERHPRAGDTPIRIGVRVLAAK